METRKVQVTGGSTFTVSLPKEWARENGISAGSEVALHTESGSLLLIPTVGDRSTERAIDAPGLDGEELARAILTAYVSGFDSIRLRTEDATGRRTAVREATAQLLGVEVVEQTGNEVVIRDLLDPGELSIRKALTRIRLITLSMLDDAVEALLEDDDDLARSVVQRDDDVDRLWFVVSRTFRSTLRDPTAATDLGLDRESCFEFHSTARQLERVADHATKIAELALELDGPPAAGIEQFRSMHEDAAAIIDTAMEALTEDDADLAVRRANEARQAVGDIDATTRELDETIRGLDSEQAQILGIVVDSISRCADYGGNVAETALQKASPRP